MKSQSQRGAAILTAMLTVVLVATLAALSLIHISEPTRPY